MDRSKKITKLQNQVIGKRTRKKCFIRLSPTEISHEQIKGKEGRWYLLEDLYLLVNKNGINPETNERFKPEDIEKIKSLYENMDSNFLDLNDIPSKNLDIDAINHNMDYLESLIEEQNTKIEENYSEILNLLREIEYLKEKDLRS